MITRRGLLAGILGAGVAPALIPLERLMKPRTSGILVPEYNDWGTRTGLIYSQEYGLKVGDIISMDVNGDRVLYRVNGQVVGSAGMVLDLQSIDDHANHVLTFG